MGLGTAEDPNRSAVNSSRSIPPTRGELIPYQYGDVRVLQVDRSSEYPKYPFTKERVAFPRARRGTTVSSNLY